MIEIVQKIEKIFGLKVKRNLLKEGRRGDIICLRGDSDKLHQLLGYVVEHNFNKNFEEVVKKLWKV
jgi:UDP-glucose 4-epimerase